MAPVIVYVALLDEGVDVWRPAAAEHIDADWYRLVGSQPDGESWEFRTGQIVRCEARRVSGELVLVAVAAAS